MSRSTKRKLKKKQTNVTAIESGIDKYMRNHPLHGDWYRKEEGFKKLFGPKPRRFRMPGKHKI